jgi:hypothetical protein
MAACLLLASACCAAQELEPRQYANLPIGMNFLVAGGTRSEGGALFEPAVALTDAAIDINGLVLGYARGLALGPYSAKFDGGVGRICLDGSARLQGQAESRHVCGATDAKLRLTVNFRGAPPLRLEEFSAYRQRLIVGASLAVSLPTGQYDSTRLVNIGTNRSAVKLEVGASRLFSVWTVETALAGTWFGTNTEFFGGRRRSQDPILSLQGHAVRTFRSGRWLAFGANYYRGGETVTGSVLNANLQSNVRIGVTWSMPVTPRTSIKIHLNRGVRTRIGTSFDALGIAWQYRWSDSDK